MIVMTNAISERILEAEAEFNRLEFTEPRKAAELAYVAAKLYKQEGRSDESKEYAKKSIAIFERIGINSLEDAAAHYVSFADVVLPSYIHEDVVRHAFPEFHL